MRKRDRNRQRVRRHHQKPTEGRALARQVESAAAAALATILDPTTPPDEAADLLLELVGDSIIPPTLVDAMAAGSRDQPRLVAEAALARGDRLAASSLAATAALRDLRLDDAEIHLRQALDLSDHPMLRFQWARLHIDRGDLLGGLALLDALLCEFPDLGHAQSVRGGLLEALAEALDAPDLPCECGSERPYRDCCMTGAREAIARFRDRAVLYSLRETIGARVAASPELTTAVDASIQEWVDLIADEGTDGGLRTVSEEEFAAYPLLLERAWLLPLDTEADDEADTCVLDRVADDPSVSADDARRLHLWASSARWGLWQTDEARATPRVLLIDCLTGDRLDAEIADEQLGMPRWSVVLGTMVPIDGVWRSGVALMQLSPSEGQAVARLVAEMTRAVARAGGPGMRDEVRWATEAGRALRDGPPAMPELLPEPPPGAGDLVSHTILLGLPALLSAISELRDAAPEVRNTDGETILLIDAVLRPDDPAATRRALVSHPEFTEGDEDPRVLTWWGRERTELEQQGMVAGMRTLAGQQALPIDISDTGRRWVRGWASFEDDSLSLRVNSRGRFDRFLDLLAGLGHPAKVVDERVVDPRHAAAHPRPPASMARAMTTAGPADASWRRTWMNERLPALGGRTPREAAGTPFGRERLEGVLRLMEHEGDLIGAPPEGMEDLRRELLGASS